MKNMPHPGLPARERRKKKKIANIRIRTLNF